MGEKNSFSTLPGYTRSISVTVRWGGDVEEDMGGYVNN